MRALVQRVERASVRVDGEVIGRHLVGEMQGHEREPGPERVVDVHGRHDRAAPRPHAHRLTLAQAETRRVLR